MNSAYPVNALFPSRILNLADALFGASAPESAKTWLPAVNVAEEETGYSISADLPGVASADVKVVVRDGVLTLSGERKAETVSEKGKYHLVERSQGAFRRSFALPKDADGEKVSADFNNGVLLVSVPRREEVKPREIEIKVG